MATNGPFEVFFGALESSASSLSIFERYKKMYLSFIVVFEEDNSQSGGKGIEIRW